MTRRLADAPPRRRGAAVLLGLWAMAGAVLFLWPHGHQLHRINLNIWLLARDHGLPHWVTPDHMEQLFNALVFIPPVLALCLLFPRIRRPWWILATMVASLGIETVQMLALPGRRFDWWDVVGNTSGAVIAAAMVMLISGLTAGVRGISGAPRRPAREPA